MKIDKEINTPFSTFTMVFYKQFWDVSKSIFFFTITVISLKKLIPVPTELENQKQLIPVHSGIMCVKPHYGTRNAFYFKTVLIFEVKYCIRHLTIQRVDQFLCFDLNRLEAIL